MVIGAHISAAGGINNVIERAKALNINAVQIFASAPQNWNPPKITLAEAADFGKLARKLTIGHIFFHAIYLINMASSNPYIVEQSTESLIADLNINAAMDGKGVIFHVGSTKGDESPELIGKVVERLNYIIEKSDSKSMLIIETNAGQGNCIGSKFEEIKALIDGVKDKKRIGVCLDTAHTYASGYDLVGQNATKVIDEFDRIVGLKWLKAIHANDSKTDLNSKVDRHENIGFGKIGDKPFGELLHDQRLANIPFILEVPGIEGTGPDRPNVERLIKLSA